MEKPATGCFKRYHGLEGTWDELVDNQGCIRSAYQDPFASFHSLKKEGLAQLAQTIHRTYSDNGIKFASKVGSQAAAQIFPFDPFPRVISASLFKEIALGLKQRILALNLFLQDIYGAQKILEAGVIPKALVYENKHFLPNLVGIQPLGGLYIHVAGIDIVFDPKGAPLILEDNLQVPSGMGYALENRHFMKTHLKHHFPNNICPIEEYGQQLRACFGSVLPDNTPHRGVLLSPGHFNAAYAEHVILAKQMGYLLVEPQDLFVKEGKLYLKSGRADVPINILYRRIADTFLDPTFFDQRSLLGIDHLVQAYAQGDVVLANALGNGVADDKATYAYVPKLIEYYLGEKAHLQQVKTYLGCVPKEAAYMRAHIDKLVIKHRHGSGGEAIFIGATATKKEKEHIKAVLKTEPEAYVAQPLVDFSTLPGLSGEQIVPRRVDYRAFVLNGGAPWVCPGGLTRVALKKQSYIVNSSQGGGSKDTWVLEA